MWIVVPDMTRLRGSWTAAAAVTLFLLSACAQTSATGASGESASPGASGGAAVPAAGDQLVLRVEQGGGIAGNKAQLDKIPAVSIYRDGRVISPGPQIAIYPAPALPSIQVQTMSPENVDKLLTKGTELAASAGDLGRPGIADGTTTTITINGRKLVAYALSEAQPGDPALTAAQQSARSKLAAFADELTGLPMAEGMTEAVQYQPAALAVLATPWVKPAGDLPSAPPVTPWPGPALPGAYLNKGAKQGCFTVTGETVDKVLEAAKSANQNTPWSSSAASWTVRFRPMLPDETGCADLQAAR